MFLQINGEPQTIPDHFSVSDLLTHLHLSDCKLAVEINREIVPANQYNCIRLSDNDTVEIIHAIGGG